MAQHVFKLVFTCLWLLLLVQELCNAAPATQQAIQNTSTTTVRPITDQIKASASNEEADDADVKPIPPTTGNGNVYGAANAGNSGGGGGGGGGEAGGTQSNRPSNRGYNQGYSYNTGIKPYRTGYTYFQPFGDAADQQNQDQSGNSSGSKGGGGGGGKATGNADNSQQQVPVEISNMLGIDPKQFGPVKVIPNQNVPVDENGIPNLDAIKIPENNQQQQQVQVQPRMRPVAAPVRPVAQPQVPVNPSDFSMGNDFNLNQILGSGNGAARPRPVQQQQYNPANDNSMFDFAPPSNQNFNFDNQNNGGGGARDYNRLDNFAGNLNNFDTYLGDAGLMMDNDNNNGGANNGGGGDNSGLADFMGGGGGGGQQQQVPSEIVNLNNAFGSNTNQQNNNDMMSILSQMNDNGNGGGGGNQGAGTNGMDFGNFGNAATNQNQFFPSFF